jgi:hypothetical protein
VYYTSFFGIWTSPSICTLNSCRGVHRSYKHNLWHFSCKFNWTKLVQYIFKIQPCTVPS